MLLVFEELELFDVEVEVFAVEVFIVDVFAPEVLIVDVFAVVVARASRGKKRPTRPCSSKAS